MTYEDPENITDICKEITVCPTINDLLNKLREIFPGFVKGIYRDYCEDYPHFDVNWRSMCLSLKIRKADILLVDDFPENDTHILIKTFCEVLTQGGFVVRPFSSYVICNFCDKVIPSKYMYDKLKAAGIKVPSTWNNACSKCIQEA